MLPLQWLRIVRNRFHPLEALREKRFLGACIRRLDVPVSARLEGIAFPVRLRAMEHFSLWMIAGGPEPEVFAAFQALARLATFREIWDIGANIGYYSWLCKTLWPEARLRLFEPDEANARLILETVQNNHLDKVTMRAVAVGEKQGIFWFVPDKKSHHRGRLLEECFSSEQAKIKGAFPVPVVTVDSEKEACAKVDLLKIDVEGNERSELAGGAQTLKDDRPILICESHGTGSSVWETLRGLGYAILPLGEDVHGSVRETCHFIAIHPERGISCEAFTAVWREQMGKLKASGKRL